MKPDNIYLREFTSHLCLESLASLEDKINTLSKFIKKEEILLYLKEYSEFGESLNYFNYIGSKAIFLNKPEIVQQLLDFCTRYSIELSIPSIFSIILGEFRNNPILYPQEIEEMIKKGRDKFYTQSIESVLEYIKVNPNRLELYAQLIPIIIKTIHYLGRTKLLYFDESQLNKYCPAALSVYPHPHLNSPLALLYSQLHYCLSRIIESNPLLALEILLKEEVSFKNSQTILGPLWTNLLSSLTTPTNNASESEKCFALEVYQSLSQNLWDPILIRNHRDYDAKELIEMSQFAQIMVQTIEHLPQSVRVQEQSKINTILFYIAPQQKSSELIQEVLSPLNINLASDFCLDKADQKDLKEIDFVIKNSFFAQNLHLLNLDAKTIEHLIDYKIKYMKHLTLPIEPLALSLSQLPISDITQELIFKSLVLPGALDQNGQMPALIQAIWDKYQLEHSISSPTITSDCAPQFKL